MFQLVKNYVSKMTREDVVKFSTKKGIILSETEVDFVYRFVKKKYKCHFSEENFTKLMKLVSEYKSKYLGQ